MKRSQRGFSLIEVLIAMAVVALGLLAVATFQVSLMKESGSNKSKTEALAIAQAHLDQLRNYTNGATLLNYTTPVTTETQFNTVFANTNGATPVNFVNSSNVATTISGTNAIYTPKYQITSSGPGKTVAVTVEWPEKDGTTQSVLLNTRIGWQSPGAVGDLASSGAPPLVPSPMGRAHLGEGTVTTATVTANTVSNPGDNTRTVNDGSGNLKLVVFDSTLTTQQVVLTLENACISGSCTSFVKISGRIYIDKAAQSVAPGNLYIKASDAAYCHRYYTNSAGTVQNVTSATTISNTPDTRGNAYDNVGDYEYFDYTCYLGGGWHGNIGVIKAGGLAVSDLACLGDPTATHAYDLPVITARRAYRAMVHKVNTGTNTPITNPATGMTIYYSAGVADAVALNNQNFVFTSLSGNPTNSSCYSANAPMTRTDSTVNGVVGALFTGMPDPFYCLNQSSSYVDPTLYNFNDTANTGYALNNSCPYDPTDPPTVMNTVSGAVTISSTTTGLETIIGTNLVLNTSDSAGNCTNPVTFSYDQAAKTYSGSYSCNVYHKGTGWSGYIKLDYTKTNVDDPNVSCTTSQINLLNVQSNTSGKNFNSCSTDHVNIIGSATSTANNKTLTSATITPTGGSAIVCAITTTTGDNRSYSCSTPVTGSTWSGTLTLNASNGSEICRSGVSSGSNTRTQSYTNITPGSYTYNVTVKATNGSCPVTD